MNDFVLALRQVRYQNRSFWRNPTVAFFTFLLPLIFLVILNALLGNNIRQLPGGRAELAYFYVPSMVALSIINACYTSLVMTISIARDDGVLKRTRGTPLPGWAYLFGRIVHAILVAALLVVIVAAFGAAFYHAKLPGRTLPAFLVTIAVGAASFSALGLALTGVIPNAEAAPAVVQAIILPLLFLSDIFIPIQDPNAWYVKLAKVFPVYHFSQAMKNAYFAPTGNGWRSADLLIIAAWGVAGVLAAV